MNKEAKLGLAIGGVLLSVLIVYLLVVSGEPAATNQVTLSMPESNGAAAETASAAEKQQDPFAAQVPPAAEATSVPPLTVPPAGSPATPEAVSPSTPAPVTDAAPELQPSGEDKWVVLHNGMVETTTTPQVQRPSLPENRPATAPPAARAADSGATSQPPQVDPPMAPPAIASGASSTETSHVVSRGETFSSISAAVYGSGAYYAHLVRANPNIDAKHLRPGSVIKVPPRNEVLAVNTPSASRTIDETSEYRVQGGDNLYKISMKLYGKPDRMDKIYEINKSTIGTDKTKLHPGQVLKLPEQPTARAQ